MSTSLFDLSGKTALATGAKRGIGRGMAEALVNEWAGQGVNVNAIAPGYIKLCAR